MAVKRIEQYELERKLGSGAGGVVYLARDTSLERPVVLKLLKRRPGSTGEMRDLMLREARLASAIDHPNVCAIYEVGEAEGEWFIAMQYVPGRTLEQLIAAGPLDLRLAVSVGIQIAEGLSAAHAAGVVHRDLKPANVMVTDGGQVKILDFGLAKRAEHPASDKVRSSSGARGKQSRGGTFAYIAPEQFVTGHSSEQTDIYAAGVILYEMIAGHHPLAAAFELAAITRGGLPESQLAEVVRSSVPRPLHDLRTEVPPDLEATVAKAMAKDPAQRMASAADLRRELLHVWSLFHDAPFPVPPETRGEPPRSGVWSMIVERLLSSEPLDEHSIAVLPFTYRDSKGDTPMLGLAVSEAIASHLQQNPHIHVKSAASLLRNPMPDSEIERGKLLKVAHVICGSVEHLADKAVESWKLVDVRSGMTLRERHFETDRVDVLRLQSEIGTAVNLLLEGSVPRPAVERVHDELSSDIAEQYLQARALLSVFLLRTSRREDLERVTRLFHEVLVAAPELAGAHSGLGVAHLQYLRHGFGGVRHLMRARQSFERALALDPELPEANLYQVFTFLARSEKQRARERVADLLRTRSEDFAVRVIAGIVLRLDGMYAEALEQFNTALRMSPADAPTVYNHRARIFHYQGQVELAMQEISKGLSLEPSHRLLRASLGYLYFRMGETRRAITTLEEVMSDDPNLTLASPTLAMCYVAAGQKERAEELITEQAMSAAEADAEMSYRLATYFAVANDPSEAFHWLRRATYLGYENYPWLISNPAWLGLRKDPLFRTLIAEQKKAYARNRKLWEKLLAVGISGPPSAAL